jgi:YggT family protein
MTDYKDVRTSAHEQGREQRITTFKITQLIWLLLGLLEAAIALRVVFKLIGVNAQNAFATLLYNITNLFVFPFASLVGAPAYDGMVLEISSIIAMIVYFLFAWGVERIVNVVLYRPRGAVSVRQTVVSDHTSQPVPLGISQVTTTDRTTTAPLSANQVTTTTQRTNKQIPGSL